MGRKDASRKHIVEDDVPSKPKGSPTTTKNDKKKAKARPFFTLATFRLMIMVGLGVLVYGSAVHVMTALHEGQTWWSAITVPEKETYFVSEQAFYYLWYKIVADRKTSITKATWSLVDDQTVEYPNRINPLQRFTIYPELILGWTYRLTNATGLTQMIPIDFYVHSAFLIQGLHPLSLFVTTFLTTNSIGCALMSAAAYFANYDHLTRSWNQVPLRETFAVPLLALQYVSLTAFLENDDHQRPRWALLLKTSMVFFLLASIISWQLSSSLLMLQLATLLVMYALGPDYLSYEKFRTLACTHVLGIVLAAVALFGNLMTACSLYSCMAVCSLAMSYVMTSETRSPTLWRRWLRLFLIIPAVLITSILLRLALQWALDIHDDDHMPNLVKAKRGTFTDFHTSLYLRIDGYRALPAAVYWELIKTGLLVVVGLVAVILALRILVDLCSITTSYRLSRSAVCHLGMAIQYTILCALISRLRGVWTPSLCILYGLIPSEVTWAPIVRGLAPKLRPAIWKTVVYLMLIIAMAIGTENFTWLRTKYTAELFSDRQSVRDLFQWIRKNTSPDAVIGTDMITSAMVRLSTGRRIVVHPHYEDKGARHRYYMVSHWLAYRRLEDVHRILAELGVEYMLDNGIACDSTSGKPYSVLIEEGEDGDPPPPMPKTRMTACHAARQPNPYFRFLYSPKGKSFGFGDFRLYQVVNTSKVKIRGSKAQPS